MITLVEIWCWDEVTFLSAFLKDLYALNSFVFMFIKSLFCCKNQNVNTSFKSSSLGNSVNWIFTDYNNNHPKSVYYKSYFIEIDCSSCFFLFGFVGETEKYKC